MKNSIFHLPLICQEKMRSIVWVLTQCICSVILFFSSTLCAQEDAPLRIELDVMENDMPFTVLTLGERGIAVVMDQNDLSKRNASRSIIFYDKYLIKRFATDVVIDNAYSYVGYKYEKDTLYFILSSLPNAYKVDQLAILKLSLLSGKYHLSKYTVKIENKTQILYSQLYQNTLLFLAKIKNDYLLYTYNFDNAKLESSLLPESAKLEWCSGQIDTLSRSIYLVFRDAKLQDRDLTFMSFDFLLQKKFVEKVIVSDENIRLTDALVVLSDSNKVMLLGSFHYAKDKQLTSSYDRGTQSSGLFSVCWKNGSFGTIHCKRYTEFNKLDTLLSPQAHKELQDVQKKAKGKTVIIPYLSLLHLRQYLGLTYLVAEVYRREETTTTDSYYDYYGRMVPYTRTIFDGFSFQDAFVLAFDSNGNEVNNWIYDASQSSKKNTLSAFVDFIPDDMGNICFAHNDLGQLMYRSFSAEHQVSPFQSMYLETGSPFDKTRKTWGGHFVHWYDKYAIAYGYEQILNNQKRGKERRNIFYLTRLVVND